MLTCPDKKALPPAAHCEVPHTGLLLPTLPTNPCCFNQLSVFNPRKFKPTTMSSFQTLECITEFSRWPHSFYFKIHPILSILPAPLTELTVMARIQSICISDHGILFFSALPEFCLFHVCRLCADTLCTHDLPPSRLLT